MGKNPETLVIVINKSFDFMDFVNHEEICFWD
jgi:hypothetical protein